MMNETMIEFKGITKEYTMGEVKIAALAGVDFTVNRGEFAIIAGPSGAGKSTILNILGGMDSPTGGEFTVNKQPLHCYGKKDLITYRRQEVGFVFQFYNLIQNLTALENVELAVEICKNPFPPLEVLKQVGLENRMINFPSQLSGGEQQRVSIARALAKNPTLLLCDEPTGALDYNTGRSVLKLLQDTCHRTGMTVVLITHNLAIAPMGDRIIKIKNGCVESMSVNATPLPVEDIAW
ncbi:Lipoprotein-releasing system ATP-binding protein LolD [Acetobacterium wieringae]|nr:Lipoprotein-releasing system ATP-binding protein LolD [Acetobacterium wieringae]